MKLLVTGATGFLGSHLVKSFLQEGHEVVILKRSFSNTWRINSILSEIAYYDLDKGNLDVPFRRHGSFDAIIHTATCYGRSGEKASNILEANTVFPLKLLEKAVEYNTYVFFNTDTFFNKIVGMYNYLNMYSTSKKHFIEWGKMLTQQKKIRIVNLALEHVYGKMDSDEKFTTYIIKSLFNNVESVELTQGEQKRDFIYINDVVAVFNLLLKYDLLKNNYYEEFEVGSGNAVSIREFVETVHKITCSKTKLKFGSLPYREGEIMFSKANINPIVSLGWSPNYDLISGITEIVKSM